MTGLVECIPNVSEGRDASTVAGLARAFTAHAGVELLQVHTDPDHNRTVFTVVGPPSALLDAVFELYERAVETIDMRLHRGVHPRVGAVDVCPFVPLPAHGSDTETCRALAKRTALAVADRFGLPVYLYRESSADPVRGDLAAIRRGQFEGLADKLQDPQWRPDVGPAEPHPTAGATIIGARGPLIATNAVLASDDLPAARAIARQVRASSGGLRGVKAMGVALATRGLVQVSMNVEEPETTPLHVVIAAVHAAATERGIELLETELVGLMPLAAVAAAAAAELRLPHLGADEVLEEAIARRLGAASSPGDHDSVGTASEGSMP